MTNLVGKEFRLTLRDFQDKVADFRQWRRQNFFDKCVASLAFHEYRRRKRGGQGQVPLKFGKKYFSGNYYEKFGHFSGQNHVKFGNFVNFSEKYYKNSGILLIFRARNM